MNGLEAFSLGTTLLGGLLQTKTSYDSAKASKEAYAIRAAIARQNSQIAEQQAQLALQKGVTAEQNVRLRTAGVFGAQRTALASNGVDLGEGSASDILASTAFLGERDALTTRDNAAREAWGYRVQGVNALNEAAVNAHASSSINPGLAAATSLLSSARSVADQWYRFGKSPDPLNYQVGTPGFNGNYLEFDP